jgi:hypothetical protein
MSNRALARRGYKVGKPSYSYTNSDQECLVDELGNVPFNFASEVEIAPEQDDLVFIAGMSIRVDTTAEDFRNVVEIILAGLTSLIDSPKKLQTVTQKQPDSFVIHPRKCRTGFVTFRKKLDDGEIRARYDIEDSHLYLSLPNTEIWETCGLDWLKSYRNCCFRNGYNPTPWRGPSCDCKRQD